MTSEKKTVHETCRTRKTRKAERETARERLHAERQAVADRALVRRRVLVAGGAVLALTLAVGAGIAIGAGSGEADVAEGRPLVIPANATGKDGTLITLGKPDAPTTLDVYEDMRCPYCATFEQKLGPTLKNLAESGRARIDFHMAAFLDKSLGGKGSKTSLAALGAALNESPDKFSAFHAVLYAAHPKDETDDVFGSTAKLLDLADQVPGLRTPAFNKAVKEGTYLPWAAEVADAFYADDVSGTPTVKANGKKLTVIGEDGEAVSPQDFTRQVDAAATAK
ncbi:thioredoxin domain-containing protein [Streptomyces sp. NPDC047981]|uniref:thioredoxin domain-containing protein n=1 Tax=Streptomyces sp. NPDC047981 TaxID=3154610 RepID=UPI0034438A0F